MSSLLRLLRLRCLVLSTTVGGSYAVHKKHKEIQEKLPDISWMKQYMPEQDIDALRKHLFDLSSIISFPDTV
ncbi:unnamed protein product, partial [Rotaria magnacalcarata]